MSQGPPTESTLAKSEGYKSRLGIYMFVIYTALYLVFVFMCVLFPKMVGNSVGKLNIAITFGFGLIIIAIIQALIYNFMCSKREKYHEEDDKAKGEAVK